MQEGRRRSDWLKGLDDLLNPLPPSSNVAVVSMLGSLCPITLAHVQAYDEARKFFLNQSSVPRPKELETFRECLGFVSVNRDGFVQKKWVHPRIPIYEVDRIGLVRLATAERPWLLYDETGAGCALHGALPELEKRFPSLNFVFFDMNGADDVAKYRKWRKAKSNWRMITMMRQGEDNHGVSYNATVRSGLEKSRVSPLHFLLGPELPPICSTDANVLCAEGNVNKVIRILHPAVADWLLRRYGKPGVDETEVRHDPKANRNVSLREMKQYYLAGPAASEGAPQNEVEVHNHWANCSVVRTSMELGELDCAKTRPSAPEAS